LYGTAQGILLCPFQSLRAAHAGSGTVSADDKAGGNLLLCPALFHDAGKTLSLLLQVDDPALRPQLGALGLCLPGHPVVQVASPRQPGGVVHVALTHARHVQGVALNALRSGQDLIRYIAVFLLDESLGHRAHNHAVTDLVPRQFSLLQKQGFQPVFSAPFSGGGAGWAGSNYDNISHVSLLPLKTPLHAYSSAVPPAMKHPTQRACIICENRDSGLQSLYTPLDLIAH